MKKRRWLVITSLIAALSLVAAACAEDEVVDETTTVPDEPTPPEETTTTAPDMEPPDDEVAFDIGVTPPPCDDAVNEGNGCIYLGVISDLTTGPFAALGVPLTAAQTHFWEEVNAAGGIDGWDVILSTDNVFDAFYDPEQTAVGYETIGDRVLALAQSLGTPQTQAIIERLAQDGTVSIPATWWSGWGFEEVDQGVILEAGAPYCFEAMNGMTFMAENLPEGFTWALVAFPGDYGGDYGAGAKIAAAQLELGDPLFEHLQIPIAFGGDVEEAVGVILENRPTLIVLVTGPTEMAQIVAGVFQGGHQEFQILGASPTWNVVLADNPDLMPLLEAVYWNTTPWGGWDSDTPGHEAMKAAADARDQGPNNAYIAGWLWSYPMKALLEAAIASGDLTKANVAEIARSLENVDHEGMLPPKSYAGDPDENVYRATWIGRADSNASDGVSSVVEEFVSPLVEAFPYESPCFVG